MFERLRRKNIAPVAVETAAPVAPQLVEAQTKPASGNLERTGTVFTNLDKARIRREAHTATTNSGNRGGYGAKFGR